MRIVFVSHEYPPQFGGGIGTFVAAMSRILAARGHAVTVVTVTQEPCPTRERDGEVEVVRLPLVATGDDQPMATLRSWQARSDAVAELLTKMAAAEPIDVIEFPDYRGEGLTYLATTEPGGRPVCVVRLHTPLSVLYKYNRSQVRYPVLESFEDQAILLAERLVSPSRALAREMREHLPIIAEPDLSPYPVPDNFIDLPIDAPSAQAEILYVGRLEERKGVECLIRAAAAFLDACPDATLHLAGGDTRLSASEPSMKARLLELLPRRARPRVVFHGPLARERLIERYRAARLCVFPSLFENFPNTCLEAMALGRPVIGTGNSGMSEMIEDGASGVIVPSGDEARLGEALIALYTRPASDLDAMGEAARQRVLSLYHPNRIAEECEALYGSYVEERVRARGEGRRPARAARAQVTVVIPCYNHGTFVGEAVESARAQRWPGVECVVVDDGSTDGPTLAALERLRRDGVPVVRQENHGLAAARNAGVRATDAPFFVPLDADDRIDPEFTARLLPPLLDDPSLGYCYSHVSFFGAASGVWPCPPYNARALLVQNLSVATAVVRRAGFDLVSGYRRDMEYGFEDWDFWIALLAVGYHGRCVPEPLFFYRKHPEGRSMLRETQEHRAAMVRKIVEHHATLYARTMSLSLTDKDAMFFDAHMEAHRLRASLPRSGVPQIPSTAGDGLFQEMLVKAELEHIESSSSWRAVERFKHSLPYRSWARLRYGAGWDRADHYEDPRRRLDRLKASRFYRLIRSIKRTPFYKWYAARKYGPIFADPLSDAAQNAEAEERRRALSRS